MSRTRAHSRQRLPSPFQTGTGWRPSPSAVEARSRALGTPLRLDSFWDSLDLHDHAITRQRASQAVQAVSA